MIDDNFNFMRERSHPFIGERLKTKCCGDIIQSKTSGHMCTCKCGKSYVDQTKEYIRTGGDVTPLDKAIDN